VDRAARWRWPYWPAGPRWQPIVPYLVLVGVACCNLVAPRNFSLVPLLSVVPPLAAIGATTASPPLIAGAVSVVATFALGMAEGRDLLIALMSRVVAVAAISVISWAALVASLGRASELERVSFVADTVQRMLLRPVPPRVGDVRIAARYVAATAGARVGGDLYEAIDTTFGLRVIVGDVRGKGLAAVEVAMDLLGVFREAAREEVRLEAVARRLDRCLEYRESPEDFVTAVLLTVPAEAGVEVLNCGHPPPLRVRGGAVSTLQVPVTSPPIGLLNLPGTQPRASFGAAFGEGDLLLLYTDGVTEARDEQGRFYELHEPVTRAAEARLGPDQVLDTVLAGVHTHSGPAHNDDIALLALTRAPKPARQPLVGASQDGSLPSAGA
jgi:serine phosphatase RsbU (regulator of sigma subunit)